MTLEPAFRWRRLLWRGMLGLLGLSVVVAILVSATNTAEAYQLIAYAVVAIVGAGLMFGASKLVDFERTRYTGVFCMAFLLVDLALLLAAWGFQNGDVAGIAAIAFGILVAAAAMVQAIQHRGGKIAGIAGLVILGADLAVSAILVATSISFDATEIVIDLWLLGVLLPLCLAGAGTDERHWRWIGAGTLIIAFGSIVYGVWYPAYYVNLASPWSAGRPWPSLVGAAVLPFGLFAVQAKCDAAMASSGAIYLAAAGDDHRGFSDRGSLLLGRARGAIGIRGHSSAYRPCTGNLRRRGQRDGRDPWTGHA